MDDIVIGSGSCIGTDACTGAVGPIGDNSCIGNFVCLDAAGAIGDNACSGQGTCAFAAGPIGDNSCNGESACLNNRGPIGDCENNTVPVLACDPDDDNDGVADVDDNCQFVANPDQANNDGDAEGDACDADDDNDTVLDVTDNCQFVANAGQANNDGDGLGDACDTDDDNDTVLDVTDNCQFVANPGQGDIDNDGEGDACEAFSFPAGGAFVISSTAPNGVGSTAYYWGSQWAKKNGGSAPSSFKGFANNAGTPNCGGAWTTGPGNSSGPPAVVSDYMAVIVSSGISKSGNTISGNIQKIVIVYTGGGSYGPNPGHEGTGTVVHVLCSS